MLFTHLCVAVLLAQLPASEAARLVAASNVRLRVQPSEEVPIAAVLPLGTDVVELAATPDRSWVRVRTDDGREGWMLEALSRRVPAGEFLRVAQDVIRGRLQRTGDGFASWIELEEFIDRVRADVHDAGAAAQLSLARLQAIQGAAIAGERYHRPVAPAFAAWLTAHRAMLVRNESGARWLLRRDVVLAEHDRFRGVRGGDLIAWYAVTTGLPGECEGDLACYLKRDNLLEAEYLRRLPGGTFIDMALNSLRERATYYREDLASRPLLFQREQHCSALSAALVPVREAVAAVEAIRSGVAARRDRTLEALDALGAVCRS